MFEFGIIVLEDGTEIIDRNATTSYESLTGVEMLEYAELETSLYILDRMNRKAEMEERNRQKQRKPFYTILAMFGMI